MQELGMFKYKENRMKKLFLCAVLLFASLMSVNESNAQRDYERIAGKNRIETAVEISKKTQNKSKIAVVANSMKYVDALPGSTLANLHKAPILLVEKDRIPEATIDELNRLGVEKIYILGGEAVISKSVEEKLSAFKCIRLAGENRYETSYEIYKEITQSAETEEVFVAAKEVDAVASAAARGENIPLLFVSENIPSFMEEIEAKKTVLGGDQALSRKAYTALRAAGRIAGKNRYETAIQLAERAGMENQILVNAFNFVDAFTSGTLAYRMNGNILLTDTHSLPKATKDYLEKNKGKLILIGGEKAISEKIFLEGDSTNPLDAAYWNKYNQYGRNILMTGKEIMDYNQAIDKESPYVRDLLSLSNKFSKSYIKDAVEGLKMPSNLTKANGGGYSQGQKNQWLNNRAINRIKDTTARYAVALQRTLIRTLPTADGNIKGGYHDYFAEDAVNPWEMMMVLHKSSDGKWCFVMTENYMGWVMQKDIAYTTKDELAAYNKLDFYVVTEPKINLNGWNMDMGTKIPQREGRPLLPKADDKGNLSVSAGKRTAALHTGYLPYTEYKLVEQALKFEGEPYGWGGSRNSHDCSSFIEDIHKVFGIKLPRNTSHQEAPALKGRVSIAGKSKGQKRAEIQKKGPGAVIYMKGHVALFLGKDAKGKDMIIHQNGSTRDCAITALDFGGSYLNAYSTIQKYR